MAIYYLDIDDEITSAVARLRTSDDPWVALALPAGSRVATSRINFRLLAREALHHTRKLAIISPETSVRAIAIAANLPAYASVAAYEEALEAERLERDSRSAGKRVAAGAAARPGGATGRPAGAPFVRGEAGQAEPSRAAAGGRDAAGGTAGPGGVTPAAGRRGGTDAVTLPAGGGGAGAGRVPAGTGLAGGPGATADGGRDAKRGQDASGRGQGTLASRSAGALPVVKSDRREPGRVPSRLLALVLAVVAVLALAGGAAAYLVLPAADITVTPVAQASGPVALSVTADPAAATADPQAAVVPAQAVSLPLSVQDTFPSTGVHVDQTSASGTVSFSSNDTIDPVTVPAGTTVATADGLQFLTTSTVVVPKATVNGTSITPGQQDAPVQAANPGPDGNVPPHAIRIAPQRLQNFLVSVDNAVATSGGTRKETKVVSQADYDAAVKALTSQLGTKLEATVADPKAAPAGMTVFPATAQMGDVVTQPTAKDLVGDAQDTFDLTASTSVNVTAVDQSQITALAQDRLRSLVPPGYRLMSDGITTTIGEATVDGARVVFPVEANAEWWRPVDAATLLADVKGKSVSQARAILSAYGDVTIRTWPGYVDSVPTLDGRATLTVAAPRRAGQ